MLLVAWQCLNVAVSSLTFEEIPEAWRSVPFFDRLRIWGKGNKFPESNDESNLPSAAVSMILRPSSFDTAELLLLQRQTVERDPWSGQISLPGGRSKTGEALLETAKREAKEETGIDLDKCEIVGSMDGVFPGTFSLVVRPFVVIAPSDISVTIDHGEIIESFWVPLNFFAEKRNSSTYTFRREGRSIQTPSFIVEGKYVVWGMTLRIIQNLLSELDMQQK